MSLHKLFVYYEFAKQFLLGWVVVWVGCLALT